MNGRGGMMSRGGPRGGGMNGYPPRGHMSRGGGGPPMNGRGRGNYRGHYQKHMNGGGGPSGNNRQNGGSFGQTWNGPPDISNLSINN